MNKIGSAKTVSVFSSLLCIALGVVFVIWPNKSMVFICKIAGWVLIILGASALLSYFASRKEGGSTGVPRLIAGITALLIGLMLAFNPKPVMSFLPTLIGFGILINGLYNLLQDHWLRKAKLASPLSLFSGLITVILGLVIILFPLMFASLPIMVIGIFLVYNGLSNLALINRFDRDMRNPIR